MKKIILIVLNTFDVDTEGLNIKSQPVQVKPACLSRHATRKKYWHPAKPKPQHQSDWTKAFDDFGRYTEQQPKKVVWR